MSHPMTNDRLLWGTPGGTPPSLAWRYASPQAFYPLAGRLVPWFAVAAALLTAAGLGLGLLVAPTDATQGDAYRIIFVHVPAAWISMVAYLAMGFWSALGLVLNTRLSFLMARALAPTGALMAFLCLWTGALWGKPTWGAWWVWDARLTSMLLLFLLYLGVMALQAAIDDPARGDRAGALLTLVGVINVPVIYGSVQWWNTLHQGASVSFTRAPTIATPMLLGLLLAAAGFWAYAIAVVLARVRRLIAEREHGAAWLRPLSLPRSAAAP
jgi:heme exporter protein C